MVMPVMGVGHDGEPDTADDEDALHPGAQGQAEFLVRGEREGFHALSFDIAATLEGLPVGPVALSGTAKGGVLVRNPFFDMSFTVPTVVRTDEAFTVYATVSNKGQVPASAVTVSLDAARLSGAHIHGLGSQVIDSIAPGDSRTVAFEFVAERTGQVGATYLHFDGPGHTGTLAFTMGVGERGIALSPDTLVVPSVASALPPSVVRAAMRVLGQAWSIANTPPSALPAGVVAISRDAVTEKALALAEAGLRITLGQSPGSGVRDLVPDIVAGTPLDPGFDQLLRATEAGRGFVAALGAALATDVAQAGSVASFEREYSLTAVSGTDAIAFSAMPGQGTVTLIDGAGRRSSVGSTSSADVVGAVLVPVGAAGADAVFGLATGPTAGPYTLELTNTAGAVVSVTFPRGDGTFTRATTDGATPCVGARAWLALVPGASDPVLNCDADGDGLVDASIGLTTESIVATAPHLLSATVVGPETLPSAGPLGLHAALLFDRVVDPARAAEVWRYALSDNRVRSAKRQLSGRLVFASLDQPEGPYVPTQLTVSGMSDLRGNDAPAETVPLGSRVVDVGAVVRGQVMGSDGTPVPGVTVTYANRSATSGAGCATAPQSPVAARLSDAQGRFVFRYVRRDICGGTWRLTASDASGASRSLIGSVRGPGEQVVADLVLLGRGTVTGTVRDLSGTIVPGARVRAVSLNDPKVGGATTADGQGRYTIPAIGVGAVSVKAVMGQAVGVASGQVVRAGTVAEVDVTLDSGSVTVSGTVRRLVQGDVVPAPGLYVSYTLSQVPGSAARTVGVAQTASDGTYRLEEMPSGPYTLAVALDTRDRASLTGIAAAGDTLANRDLLIDVTHAATISGIVRYPNGTPAVRPVVTLDGRGVQGGDDGSFTLSNAAVSDSYQRVSASSLDGRQGSAQVLVTQSGQTVDGVVITLNGVGTLDLIVLDGAGDPVSNQQVLVTRAGSQMMHRGCLGVATGTTDNSGRVVLGSLDVGTVVVKAVRLTGTLADVATLTTAITRDGATTNAVMRFGGAGQVTGVVLTDAGEPVRGASILVTSSVFDAGDCSLEPGVSHAVKSDETGHFTVPAVPVGSVLLKATHAFYAAPAGVRAVIARNGDVATVTMRFRNTIAGQLSGQVFLPDGVTPAGPGVQVTANGALPDVVVLTDVAGRYRFAAVFPAGSYALTARDPVTGGVAQIRAVLTAGVDAEHDLRLKGRGSVRVRVVDGSNEPVAQAFVRVTETEFPGGVFDGVIESASEGTVTLPRVHEGRISVEASDVNGRGGRVAAQVPAPDAAIDVTVRLMATGTVTGRFLWPDGTPIPFAAIRLLADRRVIGQATTPSGADEGTFTFPFVPAGNVRLDALDPATGRTGVAVGVIDADGQTLVLDVLAQGLGTVHGSVTSNGQPAPGAHVDVLSNGVRLSTTADAAGDYAVPGVPEGAVTATASIGGALKGSTTATFMGEGTFLRLDVAVRASGAIEGHVTRADGVTAAPPSIVTVTVGGAGGGESRTTTDASGYYRVERIAAGPAVVSVDVIGSPDTARVDTEIRGDDTTVLPIALLGVGSIMGLALEAPGVPTEATYRINGTGPVPYTLFGTVAPDGTFSVPSVIAGPFTVRLTRSLLGVTLSGVAEGVVVDGQPAGITAQLQPSGTITGTVVRSDTTTVALGASVDARRTSAVSSTVQVGSDGRFAATGLPLGTYSLHVSDVTTGGYARRLDVVIGAAGDVVDVGTLVLDDTALGIVAISPADSETPVSRTTPVVLTFTDPLYSTSGVSVKNGSADVPTNRSLSPDGRTLTLTARWPNAAILSVSATTSVTDIYLRRLQAVTTVQFRTVDDTGPTIVSVSPSASSVDVPGNAAIVVSFDEPVANTALDSVLTVTTPGGPVLGLVTQAVPGQLVFLPSLPFLDNSVFTVQVTGATDLAGNTNDAVYITSFSTTDTVAPVLSLAAPTGWWQFAEPAILVAVSEVTSGLDALSATLWLDGAPLAASVVNGAIVATPGAALAEGAHHISASIADRAGNIGSLPPTTFHIDVTPPSVPALGLADGQVVSGSISLAGTATDGGSGLLWIEVYCDGAFKLALSAPSFATAYNTASFGEGRHTITAIAVDVLRFRSAPSAPVSIVVDNHPLTISIAQPVASARLRDSVHVAATASEPVSAMTFEIGGVSVTDTLAPYEATLSVGAVPEGPASITVSATGIDPSYATATREVTIDRTAPPPPDVTRIAAEPPSSGMSAVRGAAGAVESLATVEVTHLASGVSVTTGATSAGAFVAGVNGAADDLLRLVAIDDVGNRSAPANLAIRATPSLTPVTGATTLRYEGLLADRVGPVAGGGGLVPDTVPDAVFTATVDLGEVVTRQLSFVDLDGPAGSRSTRGTSPIIGVAGEIGDPLANAPDGAVNGPVSGATSFTLFVADAGFMADEGTYTVTFGFADGTRYVGFYERVAPQDATMVAHAATITAIPATTVVGTAAAPGTVSIHVTNIRDIDGTRVPDGARVALAVASLASKDPVGSNIVSAGGEILDGTTSPSNAAFKVFEVVNGEVTATLTTGSVVPTPITGATAVVQMLAAEASGHVLGTHAVGTLDLNLRAPTDAALVTAAQTTVYAEGLERRVAVLVQVPDPDGTMLAVTVGANRTTANGSYIASVGGTIVGGAASPTTGFRAFQVSGGQVAFEYSTTGAGTSSRGQVRRAVVQVVRATASGAVSSTAAIGTATISLVGPGAVELDVSTTSLPLVQPAQTAEIIVRHALDARANLLPDGVELLITANNAATTLGGQQVSSVGGSIINGTASPSTAFRRFSLSGGRFVAAYSSDPVTGAPGQVKQANIQVAQANATGGLLLSSALGVRAIRLVAPLNAIGSAAPASLLADGGVHTSVVTFGPVVDGFGNTVPDGTRVVATAASGVAVSGGQFVYSAGGQIVDGDPSPTGSAYKAFSVQDGRVAVTFADQNLIRVPGATFVSNVSLMPALLDGTRASTLALGVVPITLAGLTSASASASPSALYGDGGDHRSLVTISDLSDALGMPVPDGTSVVVTARNRGSSAGGNFVSSTGGTIVGGAVATGETADFRVFQITNGQVVVEYSTLGALVSAAEETTAVVQVMSATSTGLVLSSTAIATAAIRLVPLGSPIGVVAPDSLVPDGGDRTSSLVLTQLVGSDGVTPLPDGARVAITAGDAETTAGGTGTPSAGGDVLTADHAPGDGAVSPNDNGFRVFSVLGGEVRARYRAPASAGGVGDTRVANLQVVPASPTGSILGRSAVATIPVSLHGVTSAVATGPTSVALNGGAVQVTFAGIKDAAGNTVPDGYLVAVTAVAGKTRNESNQSPASVGGTITDGTASTVDAAFQVFPVVNGAVTVTFQPTAAGVATLQIKPIKADGTFFSSLRALVGGWFPLTVTP